MQETLINNRQAYPPSQYHLLQSIPHSLDNHERGAALLIHQAVNYTKIVLRTTLQAVAAKVTLGRTYSICSLYLPHVPITSEDIKNLLDELPSPFIIFGDFNARNTLCNDSITNNRGSAIERILLRRNVGILNDGSPTHFHLQTGTTSVIDLALCSSDCVMDFTYGICSSLHDSDHYPTHLTLTQPHSLYDTSSRFNINKADWTKFHRLTSIQHNPDESVDTLTSTITDTLIAAAMASIPRTSGHLTRPPVPWWTRECDDAKRERES